MRAGQTARSHAPRANILALNLVNVLLASASSARPHHSLLVVITCEEALQEYVSINSSVLTRQG